VAVTDLTSRSFDEDGASVTFTGEAIGEALRESEDAVWVNVLGGSAIGVVVDRSLAEAIGTWGDYRYHGDTVHVEGVFHVACDEHGGDMDVHATRLAVIERGFPMTHQIDWYKAVIGLAGLAMAAWLVRRGRRLRAEQEGM